MLHFVVFLQCVAKFSVFAIVCISVLEVVYMEKESRSALISFVSDIVAGITEIFVLVFG